MSKTGAVSVTLLHLYLFFSLGHCCVSSPEKLGQNNKVFVVLCGGGFKKTQKELNANLLGPTKLGVEIFLPAVHANV